MKGRRVSFKGPRWQKPAFVVLLCVAALLVVARRRVHRAHLWIRVLERILIENI